MTSVAGRKLNLTDGFATAATVPLNHSRIPVQCSILLMGAGPSGNPLQPGMRCSNRPFLRVCYHIQRILQVLSPATSAAGH
ncbi:MAG TPA: hypothetical protein DCG12_17260 [Planctomycetaceae bacterium]|nr:hypothetical protein [Planctomycetaceae bacterium]